MIPYFAAVTFMLPGSTLPVGAKIPDGLFSEDQIKRLIAKGQITTLEAEQEKTGVAPPPVETLPDWGFDPAELVLDSLEILNMKAASRAIDLKQPFTPFESIEDAIEFMSMDFKPAS